MKEEYNANMKTLLEITSEQHKNSIELKNQVDAITAQLKNILSETEIPISPEMGLPNTYQTNTNSYQTGTAGSSSGPKKDNIPAEDAFSVTTNKKVTIRADANKGDSKAISIMDPEDKIPLDKNEEKYANILQAVYSIKICDSYFISPGQNVYPRVTAM